MLLFDIALRICIILYRDPDILSKIILCLFTFLSKSIDKFVNKQRIVCDRITG